MSKAESAPNYPPGFKMELTGRRTPDGMLEVACVKDGKETAVLLMHPGTDALKALSPEPHNKRRTHLRAV